MQRRSRLIKGWDLEPDDVPRPLSVPLPDYENEGGRITNYCHVIHYFPRL